MNYQAVLDQIKFYEPHFDDYNFLDLQKLNAKLTISNNYVYYGQFENNLRHGKGILLQQNGRKYEGQWQNDQKYGYGWELLANGSQYEGNYVMGKPHGQGKFIWPNGEVYEGQWNQGAKEGQGTWYGLKGEQYQGEWINNVAFGYGEHIHSNGDRYVGNFKDWLKNGEGQEYFSNGDRYQGNYLNGKPHGYGEYFWSNGAIFQGYFKDGLRCGKGIWKRREDSPSDQYQGEYDEDKKNGYGVYKWSNGNEYRGIFLNDYKHGYGEMHYVDGKILKGNWEQGKLVNEIKQNSSKKTSHSFDNHIKIVDNTHSYNKSYQNRNIFMDNQQENNNQIKSNPYNDNDNEKLSNSYADALNSNKNINNNNNNNNNNSNNNSNPASSQTYRTTKTIRIRQYQKDKSFSMSQQTSQYVPSSPKRDISEKNEKQKTQTKFCIKAQDNFYLHIRRPKQIFKSFLIRQRLIYLSESKNVSGKNQLGLILFGIVQSKREGALFNNVQCDQVYTNDYKRYIEFYAHIELKTTYTPLLREIHKNDVIQKSQFQVSIQSKQKKIFFLNTEIQEIVETFFNQFFREQIDQNYKNNFYNSSVKQFSSYSKGSQMNKVLILSHAEFIAELSDIFIKEKIFIFLKMNIHLYKLQIELYEIGYLYV
ncbi:unnamed protein product [Paramecium primaurelia]|uniref:Uncharacterized protein n=1 Tax=Paramecium primaurelia TaxID=5886 RepID=A0A8S1KTC6_PARPR|nr:unnamed protein product [Paramecium primaurelia]